MKRLLLLFTLVIFSLISNAQKDSTLVTNSDVERLVDKYSAKIEASIVSLAETLKQPAEFVYGVMIKQQYVKAYTHITIIILLLSVGIILLLIEIFTCKWEGEMVCGIIGIISLAIGIIWTGVAANMILGGLINPDYGAIQDISNLF